VSRSPRALNPNPKIWNKGSKELWHAIYAGKDLMVKMGKLDQKFENRFGMNSLKKWLNK
jgi:hypothetical protein